MSKNRKRIGVLVAVMLLLFAGQVLAQTKVLGFQLGESTYNEVKAKLPKGVKITSDAGKPGSYGGPELATDATGYGINGLQSVEFDFDKKRTLSKVLFILEERRLKDIKKILSAKYKPIHSGYPGLYLFKANCDYVYLRPPWDKSFVVDYMTDAVYRQLKLQARQSKEYKKAQERENKQMLKQEAAEEAAKF